MQINDINVDSAISEEPKMDIVKSSFRSSGIQKLVSNSRKYLDLSLRVDFILLLRMDFSV